MHLLIEEAVERHSAVVSLAGAGSPVRRTGQSEIDSQINRLAEMVEPLKLPSELVHFWSTWEPESFEAPRRANAQILDPETAIECMGWHDLPNILVPILQGERVTWMMELESSNHPGTRIFRIDYETGNQICAIGIAQLIDQISDSIESSILAGTSTEDWQFNWLPSTALAAELDQSDAASMGLKHKWPSHWQETVGISPEDYRVTGRTHTIWEFDTAREKTTETKGTLQGTFAVGMGGGTLGGDVGKLRDSSGSIQILVPNSCPVYGSLNGLVEIDVVARPSSGTGLGSLPGITHCDVPDFLADPSAPMAFMQELFEATNNLDVSVVAVAVRPLES